MKMIYNVKDRPPFFQVIVFAIQQLLAIMAATIAVPAITGNGMQPAAALLGAGLGTLVYVLFTKAKSPVFLGSSFAFLGPMAAAFAGAVTVDGIVSVELGYLGLIIGAVCAGLVYVIIALIVKFAGVGWIAKLMPPVVIGPTVAIIGLSLAGNAVGDLMKGDVAVDNVSTASPFIALICGLVTLAVTMLSSTYGKKMMRLIPFIIGILAGYAVAAVFTVIGAKTGNAQLMIIDFSIFNNLTSIVSLPEVTFLRAYEGIAAFSWQYVAAIAVAYVPVAFVVFAEHIADHKNLSTIIEKDLLEEPGLHRTLLGDGVGSIVGAIFGGCPNTTYGESVGCVAITKNASVITIISAAIGAVLISFVTPFVVFLDSIPACVMGGVCMALYGFIAVSGLKMLQKVDLEKNRNLFVASVILIAGIGGLELDFGVVKITTIAAALILGILTNCLLAKKSKSEIEAEKEEQDIE